MKKIANILSITLLSSLLACTGEVISQNVNIGNEIKPTITPSPTSSIVPNVVKPSPTPSVIPSVTPSPKASPSIIPLNTPLPKVEESKLEPQKEIGYNKIVFSLQSKDSKDFFYKETISTAPVYTDLKQEKSYYEVTTISNPKNYKDDTIYLNFGEIVDFNLNLEYLDGSYDKDYEIEIPDEFKSVIKIQDNRIYGLTPRYFYIKVTSKKNRNIFKFFNIYSRSPISEKTISFSGKVLDPAGVPVEGAKVSAKVIKPNNLFIVSEDIITDSKGIYLFKYAPTYSNILIKVAKEGWTTREKKCSFYMMLLQIIQQQINLILMEFMQYKMAPKLLL